MASDSFFDHESRLLNPWAFEFVLEGELKRATRGQNFVTLVVLEASREWESIRVSVDQDTVERLAQVVRNEVRDTDALGHVDHGILALLLPGADGQTSSTVIDRLVQSLDSYAFPAPLRISLGSACYPTEGADAGTLKQHALTQQVVSWRAGPRTRH